MLVMKILGDSLEILFMILLVLKVMKIFNHINMLVLQIWSSMRGFFYVYLGKPSVPSFRANLVDHFQPSSLDIIPYLEQKDDVLFASLEQQCFLSSRASLG